eukprot:PhM_4_TR1164/c0_g1_i1/m.65120/K04441/P38; p38 MAP kinase
MPPKKHTPLPIGSIIPDSGPHAYVVLGRAGSGGYGDVYRCQHIASKDVVAVKHMPWSTVQGECRRILREVLVLKHLRHPNVICSFDVFALPPRSTANVEATSTEEPFDVCVVMPYVPRTLCQRDSEDYTSDDKDDNERLMVTHLFCLLRGLDYYHKCGLVHRDLSPRNVLINDADKPEEVEVYLADFGMAREETQSVPCERTFYVTTRPYRAPENIYGSGRYDQKIDIWALGCIVAELMMKRRLFNIPSARDTSGRWSGPRAAEQLMEVLQGIGAVDAEDIEAVPSSNVRSYLHDPSITSMPHRLPEILESNLEIHVRPDFIGALVHLVQQCLSFNPAKRPTAEDILRSWGPFQKHGFPYMQQVGTPCPIPDVSQSTTTTEEVLSMLRHHCSHHRYRPFVMTATTPDAQEFSERLRHWESIEHCRTVHGSVSKRLEQIDDALDPENNLTDAERERLEATAFELLTIQMRLERFVYAEAAEGMVTQGTVVCIGNMSPEEEFPLRRFGGGGVVEHHDDDNDDEEEEQEGGEEQLNSYNKNGENEHQHGDDDDEDGNVFVRKNDGGICWAGDDEEEEEEVIGFFCDSSAVENGEVGDDDD